MIISNCPRCQEGFRVPAGQMPDDAYATCPWCRETFPLSEVLANLPPTLEILSADGQPLVFDEAAAVRSVAAAATTTGEIDDSAEGFEVLDEDLDATVGNETVTSETIAEDSWNQTSFEVDEDHVDLQVEDPNDSWDSPQVAESPTPMTLSPRPGGSRKKKPSGLRTMLGIVVGGLLSVPIALGILLLFGREPDLGFWPFDGPSGSRRSPVAAPPGQMSERTRDPNRNRGRMLDTSAFDSAMDAIEDPATTALDAIVPPELGSDPRQPDAMELAIGSDQPTLVDVSDIGTGLELPDLAGETRSDEATDIVESEAAEDSANVQVSADTPMPLVEPTLELPATGSEENAEETSSLELPSSLGDPSALTLDATATDDEPAPEDVSPTLTPAVEPTLEPPTIDSAIEDSANPEANVEMSAPDATVSSAATEDESTSADLSPPNEDEKTDPKVKAVPAPSSDAVARVDLARESLRELLDLDVDDSNRKRQLATTYSKIAEACDLTADDRGALQPLASEILKSPLLDDIEYAGTQWLVFASRPTDGIALIGRPGTSPEGEIVTLGSGKIINLTGDTGIPTVEKVMIMGKIVDGETTVEVVHVEALPALP
ncbi:MAG: hypothetical protein ACR2NZ_04380 [Rubripirellula sp.]